jgi:spoIIIJ-associated protein
VSIPDKIAAANKINDLLKSIVSNGGLRLKYRITVDPPLQENRDWERPEILVEFVGPDSSLLLERGGELLRSVEFLALEMLRLPGNEHEKICFDCMNHRGMRLEELRLAAGVAADRVRKSGAPYEFAPMSSRERRIVHALRAKAKAFAVTWWFIRRTTSCPQADLRVKLFPDPVAAQFENLQHRSHPEGLSISKDFARIPALAAPCMSATRQMRRKLSMTPGRSFGLSRYP